MTFEEEFPSLKENNTVVQREGVCYQEDDLYYEDVIQEHCLDKQRVKDALLKHTSCDGFDYMDAVLEELGLEDE